MLRSRLYWWAALVSMLPGVGIWMYLVVYTGHCPEDYAYYGAVAETPMWLEITSWEFAFLIISISLLTGMVLGAISVRIREEEEREASEKHCDERRKRILEGRQMCDNNDLTAFAAYARDLQPAAAAMLEREGYKFTDITDDSWQKVAFTLYTDLCELNLKARQVLGEDDG